MSTPDAPGAQRPITPQDPPQWRKITPENPPQFPCWLWHTSVRKGNGWSHAPMQKCLDDILAIGMGCTHWHPDQPTAPEVRPDKTTQLTALAENPRDRNLEGPQFCSRGAEGHPERSESASLAYGATNSPTPAETGTPTPEAVLISAVSILEHNGSVAIEVGKQLRDVIAELVSERDEARRERDDHEKYADLCEAVMAGGALTDDERVQYPLHAITEGTLESHAALRHLLAAAEALLEARTRALDTLMRRINSTEGQACYDRIKPEWESAVESLSLTPEQALAEKEGVDKPKHD